MTAKPETRIKAENSKWEKAGKLHYIFDIRIIILPCPKRMDYAIGDKF